MTSSHKSANHIFTIPRWMGVYVLNTRSARHAFQYFVNNLPPRPSSTSFHVHKSAAKLASQLEKKVAREKEVFGVRPCPIMFDSSTGWWWSGQIESERRPLLSS